MIASLCRRPGFRHRSRTDEERGKIPLPLICLVREHEQDDFLKALSAKLRQDSTPHALVNADNAEQLVRKRFRSESNGNGSDLPLLPLLDQIRHDLRLQKSNRARLSRFDHYRLAEWLTRQHLPPPAQRDDGLETVALLRTWISKGRRQPDVQIESDPTGLSLWILQHVGPAMWFWLWSRGYESRWFMGQDYLTAHSPDFLRFAQRLTRGHREAGSGEEIKKLLVHAFLQDLRVAYHRQILPFRPRAWRRTAHVVVLVDNVTEANGGWELLRLINDVRNETGDPDPLLMVVSSNSPPPGAEAAGLRLARADRSADALIAWRNALPGRRQRKEDLARYLAVSLPASVPATATGELTSDDEFAWQRVDFRPPPPPWLARRYVMPALMGVLILGISATGVSQTVPWRDADCFPFGISGARMPSPAGVMPPDIAGLHVWPEPDGRSWECVGYSDSTLQIFGDSPRLRSVQREVFWENEEAARLHRRQPHRPLVSLVYFAGFTDPHRQLEVTPPAAEELGGLLMRQRDLNVTGTSQPLLRVIVANGGYTMRLARTVARKALGPLLIQDPSVMGVVGMERTTAETERAITELGDLGVPVVGTNLTGTRLGITSPLYFQLVPDNAAQARLVKAYAEQLGVRRVNVYHPNVTGDTYVSTLVAALHKELGELTGGPKADRVWTDITQVTSICDEPGDHGKEIAFYAGRREQFTDFARGLTRNCDRDTLPRIVGDDSITRFVVDAPARESSGLKRIPLSYVSLGGPLTLAGRRCVLEGTPARVVAEPLPMNRFCDSYRSLTRKLRDAAPQVLDIPSERMGLAYDAVGLFLEAVQLNRARVDRGNPRYTPHRAAIAGELREVKYEGVTGEFNFAAGRIAREKMISIISFDDIGDPTSPPKCVFALNYTQGPKDGNGCPTRR